MVPKVHPRMLPDTAAQVCTNARLRSGALVPFRGEGDVTTLDAAAGTIYPDKGRWLGWPGQVWAVPGPVAEERIYVAGDGPPRVESHVPGSEFSFPLRLDGPTGKPSVAVQSGTVDPDIKEVTAFAYTWVTALDEESPPSRLSHNIDYTSGMVLRISGFKAAPTDRGIDRLRIYRAITDYAGETLLYFAAEIDATATEFDYDDETYPPAEVIASTDYDNPRNLLKGLTAMPNGIIAGFVGRQLCFSEPYRPHAWPRKYELFVDYPIVGLAAFGSTLAILTEGLPYIVQGSHPDNMTMTKLEQNLPCVSARGIVDMGYAAVYPSNDGLVQISAQGAQLATKALFTREDWLSLSPSGFVASQYEGRYVFLHTPQGADAPVMGMIDLSGETPFFITADTTGTGLAYEIETGKLYVLDPTGLVISEFDADGQANKRYVWRSKRFDLPMLTNFGAARLDADAIDYSDPNAWASTGATARIFASGREIAKITDCDRICRLPGGRLDERFEVEITGDRAVTGFAMAAGIAEMMQ